MSPVLWGVLRTSRSAETGVWKQAPEGPFASKTFLLGQEVHRREFEEFFDQRSHRQSVLESSRGSWWVIAVMAAKSFCLFLFYYWGFKIFLNYLNKLLIQQRPPTFPHISCMLFPLSILVFILSGSKLQISKSSSSPNWLCLRFTWKDVS